MRFIDEKYFAGRKIREHRREVTGLLERRAGRRLDHASHFARHKTSKRRLAEPGRAGKKKMVGDLFSFFRGLKNDLQVVLDLFLPDVIVPPFRAKREVDGAVVVRGYCWLWS